MTENPSWYDMWVERDRIKLGPAKDAINEADDALFQILGIRGLGEWAYRMRTAGYTDDAIARAARYGTGGVEGTDLVHQQYLKAFPMMDVFLERQYFVGPDPEMQYLEFRKTVRDSAQAFGVDKMLVTDEKIAEYILGRNTAEGLTRRMATAAAAVATTPPETLSALQQYYGVNSGDLITFYLNPDETEAMLNQRYTAAQIGGAAARQKFGVSQTEAELLAKQGTTVAEARQGFAQAALQEPAFTQGVGETATREQILGAQFGDTEAAQKLERIAQSRTGRFTEGGGFVSGQQGATGLGTSTTR